MDEITRFQTWIAELKMGNLAFVQWVREKVVDEFAPFAVLGEGLLVERRPGRQLKLVYQQTLSAPFIQGHFLANPFQ